MKIYHGSKTVVDSPVVKGSSIDNDYGPAFYLTKDLKSAHEWACRNNTIGFVNEYIFDDKDLKILDLTDSTKWSVLNWLAVLMHFRKLESNFVKSFSNRLKFIEDNYFVDVNEYDVVIGYRADDAYFRFPLDFIRGNITLEQLSYSFDLGNLGIQIVLMSEKSFTKLTYVKSYLSEEKYLNLYFERVKETTNQFDDLGKDEDGIRIMDLLRGNKK